MCVIESRTYISSNGTPSTFEYPRFCSHANGKIPCRGTLREYTEVRDTSPSQIPPSSHYTQSRLQRGDSEFITFPLEPPRIPSDTATPVNETERLNRTLIGDPRRERELEVRIDALLKENEALQRSYQQSRQRARQLNTILRGPPDLVTKTDEPAEGHKILPALRSVRMEDAYNADKLLLSVQEDWSGRGSHAEFKRGETIPLQKGRVLGYGMNGEVVEATCKGVKVALKKIHNRRRNQIGQMKEIDVLKN